MLFIRDFVVVGVLGVFVFVGGGGEGLYFFRGRVGFGLGFLGVFFVFFEGGVWCVCVCVSLTCRSLTDYASNSDGKPFFLPFFVFCLTEGVTGDSSLLRGRKINIIFST